ncbi:alpha/beta-hydrolase [Mycena polygramma]|nr:alpha/beta-hydrolase [Mycena polygramma]
MRAFAPTSLLLGWIVSTSFASPLRSLSARTVTSTVYDDLVLYTKYSSAAYQSTCSSPLGNTLVESFAGGDTNGFIARDDNRKEIVVSFRGTFSVADAVTDVDLFLTPFVSPGISKSFEVHSGFLDAYNDVADTVLSTVEDQVTKFPTYTVVVTGQAKIPETGHSLGGALASLGAVSLKTAIPAASMKLYTFGQPRTGDPDYAAFVDSTIGVDNIFRGVHTSGNRTDGVPTIIPEVLGYQHHSTEYWQFEDPDSSTDETTTVTKCTGDEDPTCSDSIPSGGIDAEHVFYFGQVMAINPLLCV